MKKLIDIFIFLCSAALLLSCEKALVLDQNGEIAGVGSSGTSLLTVTTRAGSDDNGVAQGRIYVFNQSGTCIQLATTDEDDNTATMQLAAGSYSLYAVGGDDLSRFVLPAQSGATTTSVISLVEGKVMDDLLMKRAYVTLEDGETLNQTIALEHKVLCIDAVEIKQVPQTVTKVEVSITPLYSTIRLDGTYPDTPIESYKVELTKQDDGKTWQATPRQMLFPSRGTPTVKVSFTTESGIRSYSYTATEELPANHHFTISGTYKAAQGVSLTGILTASDWGEDRTITFDFDDDNQTTLYNPVVGEYCNGYIVVSVDEESRTAVLLAKSRIDFERPSDNTDEEAWRQALVAPTAALELPENISGSWRLPTLEEVAFFTAGTPAVTYGETGDSPAYFCTYNNALYWAYTRKTGDDSYELKKGTGNYNNYIYLRPVIDINY